jgi:sulfur relay protein TusB/DsrH
MVLCILSGYDASRLDIASQLAEKSPKPKVVLLSDALYLVFDKKNHEKVKKMLGNGVSFYALDSDATKRGLNMASETVVLITYDILVELLLKNEDGIVNL